MARPDVTQELLLLALAEQPPDVPETILYKFRERARLPPARWRASWRAAPEEEALAAELCQQFAAAHPGDPQSRRSRVIASSLDLSSRLGQVVRDVGAAPTPQQLEALEAFCAGFDGSLASLRKELGLAGLPPEGPRARDKQGQRVSRLKLVVKKAISPASLRKAAQLVEAYIRAGRLTYPTEAYMWSKLRQYLASQVLNPGGHAKALGRALRVAFYPADVPHEDPETLVCVSRRSEAAALERLAEWAAELLPCAPEDFSWPCEGGSDWFCLVLRKLPLLDLLTARGVSAAWGATVQPVLREALMEQTAKRPSWFGARADRGGVVQRAAALAQERAIRWFREVYGTHGPHLVRYFASIENVHMGRSIIRALEGVPNGDVSPHSVRIWAHIEEELRAVATRAAAKHRELFGDLEGLLVFLGDPGGPLALLGSEEGPGPGGGPGVRA